MLTVMYSPAPRTGQTTIANYLANELGKQDLTLLIEFNKVTGRSLYINKKVAEHRRSLSNVIFNPLLLKENVLQSKDSKLTYFLCLNMYKNFMSLDSYTDDSLQKIITQAKEDFVNIIIDLPSDLKEKVVGTTLSRNFSYHIDNIIVTLDEDAQTFKRLNDMSALLKITNESPKEVTYVVNKTTCHYVDFIDASLNLPYLKCKNILKLEYMEDMVSLCNEGNIYGIGKDSKAKRFLNTIEQLRQIVCDSDIRGIGVAKSVIKANSDINTQGEKKNKKNNKDKKKSLFKKKDKKQILDSNESELVSEDLTQEVSEEKETVSKKLKFKKEKKDKIKGEKKYLFGKRKKKEVDNESLEDDLMLEEITDTKNMLEEYVDKKSTENLNQTKEVNETFEDESLSDTTKEETFIDDLDYDCLSITESDTE